MDSPSKVKQDILGRLIAERLHGETEPSRELYLREALQSFDAVILGICIYW